MIKGFIFDLDGVITDTAELHFMAWKNLADGQEWYFDRVVNEKLRGVSRMDSLRLILEHNQVVVADLSLKQLADEKNSDYIRLLETLTPSDYLPGAQELLNNIRVEGFLAALGSASKNAAKVLEQLQARKYFDVIGDGNSVAKGKPAPDIFLYAADELKLKPNECIVVEDAKSGIDAALAGGFHTIGIGPEERVGHADLRFDSMGQATLFEIKSHFSHLFS